MNDITTKFQYTFLLVSMNTAMLAQDGTISPIHKPSVSIQQETGVKKNNTDKPLREIEAQKRRMKIVRKHTYKGGSMIAQGVRKNKVLKMIAYLSRRKTFWKEDDERWIWYGRLLLPIHVYLMMGSGYTKPEEEYGLFQKLGKRSNLSVAELRLGLCNYINTCTEDRVELSSYQSKIEKYHPLMNYYCDFQGVMCSIFSPDGRYVAITYMSGRVQLFNVARGALWKDWIAHDILAKNAAFSPNGSYLATIGRALDCDILKVWHVQTKKLQYTLSSKTLQNSPTFSCVRFDADNNFLVAASVETKTIGVFNMQGELVREFDVPKNLGIFLEVAFDETGHYVLSASQNRQLNCWDIKTGKCVKTLHLDTEEEISSLSFSQRGDYLVSGHQGGGVNIWEVKSGTSWLRFEPIQNAHHNTVCSATLDPTCKYLLTTRQQRAFPSKSTFSVFSTESKMCIDDIRLDTGVATSTEIKKIHVDTKGRFVVYASEYALSLWGPYTTLKVVQKSPEERLAMQTKVEDKLAIGSGQPLYIFGNEPNTTIYWPQRSILCGDLKLKICEFNKLLSYDTLSYKKQIKLFVKYLGASLTQEIKEITPKAVKQALDRDLLHDLLEVDISLICKNFSSWLALKQKVRQYKRQRHPCDPTGIMVDACIRNGMKIIEQVGMTDCQEQYRKNKRCRGPIDGYMNALREAGYIWETTCMSSLQRYKVLQYEEAKALSEAEEKQIPFEIERMIVCDYSAPFSEDLMPVVHDVCLKSLMR